MDKEWLAERLAAGRSIESIAREVERDPSTVSYWLRKHGLRSEHAGRHAARGGLERASLERLVEAGASTREIGIELGVSQATVRHWLGRYGLRTAAAERRATRVVRGDGEVRSGRCPDHGDTSFIRRPDGYWRCLRCRSEHVATRRRRVKRTLIDEAGGQCVLCGYARCVAALHFHHLDPSDKRFHLSYGGFARSLESARDEAAKCVLLCANCHAEVEAGVANLSASPDIPG